MFGLDMSVLIPEPNKVAFNHWLGKEIHCVYRWSKYSLLTLSLRAQIDDTKRNHARKLFFQPRPHEAGGKYGNGIVVRRYKMDSAFTIRVELTANHKGYFEFRLCPHNSPHRVVSQSCLDKYLLTQARTRDGRSYGDEPAMEDDTKYYPANGTKVFEMKYMLPKGMTCTQCVVQWRYFAG